MEKLQNFLIWIYKDELSGQIMKEFVGFRGKTCRQQ